MPRSLTKVLVAACAPALGALWLACGESYSSDPEDPDGGEDGARGSDSFVPDSAIADAADAATVEAACDLGAPFESAAALPGVINTNADELFPTLTDDELTLYFQRGPIGGGKQTFYVAQRKSTAVPFGDPVPVTELDNENDLGAPSVTANGDTLYFTTRADAGSLDLRVAVLGPMGRFGASSSIPDLTTPGDEKLPAVFGRGEELWFAQGDLVSHLRRSTRLTGGSFTAPEAIPELEEANGEGAIASSRDGLTLYFGSRRDGGVGDVDIWIARRQSRNGKFTFITSVPSASSTAAEAPAWLSADNCRLYLTTTRLGTFDIFVATRRPPP
jgi:hypothetical protein